MAAVVIAPLFGSAALGCSILMETDEVQCELDADCAARGFDDAICDEGLCASDPSSLDPDWGCLGRFEPPDPDGDVTYPFQFELATEAGVAPEGLVIRLCEILDVDCQNPVLVPSDAAGLAEVTVPATFQGFMEVESDETIPSHAHLGRVVVLPPKRRVVRLIRPNELAALATAADQTIDPERSIAVLLTTNCQEERTAGVRVESPQTDAETVPFYFRGALPDPEALATDEQGAAGYLNLPTRTISVESFRAETDQRIGQISFRAKAGHIIYVPLGPSRSGL